MEQQSIEQFIAKDLHNLLYLEEFVYPSSKFSPRGRSEVELADAVVVLHRHLLIFQIKERSVDAPVGSDSEQKWFEKKVVKQATRQIRDTLRFLSYEDDIPATNGRGRSDNLAARNWHSITRIIVYRNDREMPSVCDEIRHYVSAEGGFIHIIKFEDYVRLTEFLRVPEEIRLYFEYREYLISSHPKQCGNLPEACLVAGFLNPDDQDLPDRDSYRHLHSVLDDEESWNLIPLLSGIHDHEVREQFSADHYRILEQFIRLPRSMWREIKIRFELSVEKVSNDEFVLPYRVSDPERDVGFVLVPMTSKHSARDDWADLKVRALVNMTELHKFDQKLQTCVGILVGKIGDVFDIDWCLVDRDWAEDKELRRKLDENYPFRPVAPATKYGFFSQS